jgi:serine phosphatase RsbU (regulator of sigma subunit)
VTEARSPGGEEFGLGRLARALIDGAQTGSAAGVVDHVMAKVRTWEGDGNPQSDDITVLTLRRT